MLIHDWIDQSLRYSPSFSGYRPSNYDTHQYAGIRQPRVYTIFTVLTNIWVTRTIINNSKQLL